MPWEPIAPGKVAALTAASHNVKNLRRFVPLFYFRLLPILGGVAVQERARLCAGRADNLLDRA